MKADFNVMQLLQAINKTVVFTNASSKSLDFQRLYVNPLAKKYVNAGYRSFPAAVQFDTTNTGLKELKKTLELLEFEEKEDF